MSKNLVKNIYFSVKINICKNFIKKYFDISNIIRRPYKDRDFYSLEVYRKDVLKKIIHHCEMYPLLGAKKDSLLKFKEAI